MTTDWARILKGTA